MLSILYCFSVTDNNFSCCSSKWPVVTINCILATVQWREKEAKTTYRWRNTTSTSTSSRSSCKKSFRKCETDSYVMCPQTTMCLMSKFNYGRTDPGRGNENRSRNSIFFRSTVALIDDVHHSNGWRVGGREKKKLEFILDSFSSGQS